MVPYGVSVYRAATRKKKTKIPFSSSYSSTSLVTVDLLTGYPGCPLTWSVSLEGSKNNFSVTDFMESVEDKITDMFHG